MRIARMDEGCPFCSLALDTTDRSVIYDDPELLAFMDIHPINPGHLLVIPRMHQRSVFDLEAPLYGRVMLLARALAQAVERVFAPPHVGLLVAGFDVAHAHVHVLPLCDYRDITSKAILEGRRGTPDRQELSAIAGRLREHLPQWE